MTVNPMFSSRELFMGATPYQDGTAVGVTFRVWAPFAQKVTVVGQFNNWSTDANPLYSEGKGYWSVDVPGATVGQQYKLVVSNPVGNQLWRMDPYARSIIHDDNGNLNGFIASSDTGYDTP